MRKNEKNNENVKNCRKERKAVTEMDGMCKAKNEGQRDTRQRKAEKNVNVPDNR